MISLPGGLHDSSQNGGGCTSSACRLICARTVSSAEWAPTSAGFLLERNQGKYVVTQVYRNSPAEQAGLKRGDVLLTIAEAPVSDVCDGASQSAPTPYRILRAGRELTLTVSRVSLRRLVSASLTGGLSNVRLQPQQEVPSFPYVSGLVIEKQNGALVVNSVLPNTPAAEAGIRSGDLIVQVNGRRQLSGHLAWSQVEGADFRAELNLSVQRGRHERPARLVLRSVSEILEGAQQQPPSTVLANVLRAND